jgi:hypothetical protein
MSLRISFHAGLCCAVKHIHGFHLPPDWELAAEPDKDMLTNSYDEELTPDLNGDDIYSKWNPYYGELPAETMEDRLKRLVKFITEEWRGNYSSGVIEVILTPEQFDVDNGSGWGPVLDTMGFVTVHDVINSNTDDLCRIYHLYYGQPEEN